MSFLCFSAQLPPPLPWGRLRIVVHQTLARMEECANKVETISNAFAGLVRLEKRAWRGILALIVLARMEEYARKVEMISTAFAWLVGLERRVGGTEWLFRCLDI